MQKPRLRKGDLPQLGAPIPRPHIPLPQKGAGRISLSWCANAATPPTGVGICNLQPPHIPQERLSARRTPCQASTRRGVAHSIQLAAAGLQHSARHGQQAARRLHAKGYTRQQTHLAKGGGQPENAVRHQAQRETAQHPGGHTTRMDGHFEMTAADAACVRLCQCQIRAAAAALLRWVGGCRSRMSGSCVASQTNHRISSSDWIMNARRRVAASDRQMLVCDDGSGRRSVLASPVRPYRSWELKGFLVVSLGCCPFLLFVAAVHIQTIDLCTGTSACPHECLDNPATTPCLHGPISRGNAAASPQTQTRRKRSKRPTAAEPCGACGI